MEAALLSNTLHEFADSDIEGVKPVISKITAVRAQWTKVKKDIAYFEKTGKLPEDPDNVPVPACSNPAGLAEQRVELARLNSNISKHIKKIANNPDHKKIDQWREDLAKMEALKLEVKHNITELIYASK